jgi:hypothetical protein
MEGRHWRQISYQSTLLKGRAIGTECRSFKALEAYSSIGSHASRAVSCMPLHHHQLSPAVDASMTTAIPWRIASKAQELQHGVIQSGRRREALPPPGHGGQLAGHDLTGGVTWTDFYGDWKLDAAVEIRPLPLNTETAPPSTARF